MLTAVLEVTMLEDKKNNTIMILINYYDLWPI